MELQRVGSDWVTEHTQNQKYWQGALWAGGERLTRTVMRSVIVEGCSFWVKKDHKRRGFLLGWPVIRKGVSIPWTEFWRMSRSPLEERIPFLNSESISSNLAFHSQGFSVTFRWLAQGHHPLLSLNRDGSAWKFRWPPPPRRMAPSTKASLLYWPVGQQLRHKIHFRACLESGRVWDFTQHCTFACLPKQTLESTLDSKEIKLVNPKGNQPWIVIGRADAEAEAETPVLGPFDVKSQLIGKYPDAGKDWRQKEKRAAEDEMVGWHHWLNGHESEHSPGNGWRTGKPDELQSMWLQKVGHDWVTEQQLASEVPDWLHSSRGASGLNEQPVPESLLSVSWEDQPPKVSIRTGPQQLYVSEIKNIRSNELVLYVKIIHEPWCALLCWWLYYILSLQLPSKAGPEKTWSVSLYPHPGGSLRECAEMG